MDASITVEEFPINSQNASALAKKRWDAWRAERDAAKMLKLNPPPKIEVEPAKQSKDALHAIIAGQIERIDEEMLDCDANSLVKLAQAKATLWKLLFPQPKAQRSRRDFTPAEPIE